MQLPDIDSLRRSLPLPPLLCDLMRRGLWRHPGDHVLRSRIPFIRDRLVVLTSLDAMLFESGPLMGQREIEEPRFSEYRGSVLPPRDLPWIDVEKAIFILCNEEPGADVGIALDYRLDRLCPRVIGGDWFSGDNRLIYRRIASSFDEFAHLIGLPVDR